ncbi:hypothetical protein LX64_00332 [Chitinophaga skermanii]|uniref:Uncharacterized protein n=1 Tax=Chitinophaga skermanii TaxID=331697 RepID=A0A327R1H5_9BACT|nr:hypothetical protein [Chitinophaga skermanii]RAJ10726.1 hypothetical protein LX64_00332 [Chitinophaga skermanii]
MKHFATWCAALLACVIFSSYAFRSADTNKPTLTIAESKVTVKVDAIGIEQLKSAKLSAVQEVSKNYFVTIPGTGPVGPVEPWDPIICDGMTHSQLWADISTRYNNWRNSAAGAAAQQWANQTCQPYMICFANCGLAVLYAIEPTNWKCNIAQWYGEVAKRGSLEAVLVP